MFQLSSPGREGEKLLLEYSRIHDRWQWVAYEGNWNPDNRQFAIRQAVFKTEDRTVLDENGLHTWQMNRNASKSAQPVASEAPDWEGHLVCSTRHVITNNAWHENWDGSKRGMIVPLVTWFPRQWINQWLSVINRWHECFLEQAYWCHTHWSFDFETLDWLVPESQD